MHQRGCRFYQRNSGNEGHLTQVAGRALLDAALDLAKDNFGSAMDPLGKALALGSRPSNWTSSTTFSA
jgi:hypothetical protein